MTASDTESASNVAFCGYVCSACPGAKQGCPGCRAGGGDEGCPSRACAQARQLAGCWQCSEFPCARNPFGSEEWRGLSTGMVECARVLGPAELARRVAERMGGTIDFDHYRGRSVAEVTELLQGPPQKPK